MNIRTIKQSDNNALATMIRKAFIEYDAPQQGTVYSDPTTDALFELFQVDRSVLWVAEDNNNVIGCCGIYPTEGLPENYAEIVKFYLAKESRGKGIGKALLEKSINSAQQIGFTELYIESLPQFSKAVDMYIKLGFEHLKQPMGNSGHTSCNIWMIKKI